jgi:GGDEF domain-containing protein
VAYNGQSIPVTVSVGMAVLEVQVPADYDKMKHLAAAALSEAKTTGKNRCVIRTLRAPQGAV